MEGFRGTVVSSLLALVGSFALGTLIAVFRIGSIRALRWFGTGYVEFIRNIPLLLVVYIFYYGPAALGLPLDGFTAGTIGLAVYTSSFIAEAIRAGIMSIPRGQTEAARSSGLSYAQTMVHIVLPQAIRLVIPPLGNQFINLIKNSSVLTIVAGLDLMYFADIVNTDTFKRLIPMFLWLCFIWRSPCRSATGCGCGSASWSANIRGLAAERRGSGWTLPGRIPRRICNFCWKDCILRCWWRWLQLRSASCSAASSASFVICGCRCCRRFCWSPWS